MPETLISASAGEAEGAEASEQANPAGRPRLLHVRCPQGHRLEAPCTLDGQDVVCPYCSERFPFSYEESDEFDADRWKVTETESEASCRGHATWQEWVLVALVMAGVGATVHQVLIRWF